MEALEIARQMKNGCMDMNTSDAIKRADKRCRNLGGRLVSRQAIAAIIAAVEVAEVTVKYYNSSQQ